MKRTLFALFALLISVSSFAQFERDKCFINTSLTNFGLSYSSHSKLNLGAEATAGYFIEDNWALIGQANLDYNNKHLQEFAAGAGIRYYIIQNGIFLGVGGRFWHEKIVNSINDFQIKAEIGYAFFLSHTVTVEPAIYYNQSFKDQDYSRFGLKIGFGYYF